MPTTKLPASTPTGSRQLPERLIVAAHQSIDLGDTETASRLLGIVEDLVKDQATRPRPSARRIMEGLVAAHQRIWNLRHQDHAAEGTALGAEVKLSDPWGHQQDSSLPVIPSRWAFENGQHADDMLAVGYPEGQYQ